MNTHPTAALQEESAPAAHAVFDHLVRDIVNGTYPAGTRLPAERELSRQLGASRPTLREALRRMSEWGLVEARRGSGVVVQEMRNWSIDVFPAFLMHGKFGGGEIGMGRVIQDLLTLRRNLMSDVLGSVVDRIPKEGVGRARDHLERAWENRTDIPVFAREDLAIYSTLLEAAKMLPALWMLNSIAKVYFELAPRLGPAIAPPADYHESMTGFLDAVEAGKSGKASKALDAYFQSTDDRLAALLESLGT